MAVSVSSLFSASRLFNRRVFNVMFKNSGIENKGLRSKDFPSQKNGQDRAETGNLGLDQIPYPITHVKNGKIFHGDVA